MENVMIDLETLGTSAGSVILSLGAVYFDMATMSLGREFYSVINQKSCVDAGLQADPDTVIWWMKQSDDARKVLSESTEGGAPLDEALYNFNRFLEQNKTAPQYVKVWGNGSDFDNVLLVAAFKAVKRKPLWRYSNNRCFRTLKNLMPFPTVAFDGVQHNALADAKHQALCAMTLLRKLPTL